jgi:hypothetical protein
MCFFNRCAATLHPHTVQSFSNDLANPTLGSDGALAGLFDGSLLTLAVSTPLLEPLQGIDLQWSRK